MEDFIFVKDDFIHPDWCSDLIAQFENRAAAGFGYNRGREAGAPLNQNDTGIHIGNALDARMFDTITVFMDAFWTQGYMEYMDKYPILKNLGDHAIQSMKVARTRATEAYHVWHCEESNRNDSNRLLAFMVYLNTVEEGGETEFLFQSKRVKPVTGRLLIFPTAFTHTHRGNPPLSNTKYTLTGWLEF